MNVVGNVNMVLYLPFLIMKEKEERTNQIKRQTHLKTMCESVARQAESQDQLNLKTALPGILNDPQKYFKTELEEHCCRIFTAQKEHFLKCCNNRVIIINQFIK